MAPRRPLEAEAYPYVFVDARYEKVRIDAAGFFFGEEGVLIVTAVREDGFRELLGVWRWPTPRARPPIRRCCAKDPRAFRGVELVVSDDHEGLKADIGRHFQGASSGNVAKFTTTPGTS